MFAVRESPSRRRKPPDIVYGVEDTPPLRVLLLSAAQHVASIAMSAVTPVIILHQAHVSNDAAAGMIGVAFLGMALAVLLQALPRGPVGSGFLAPSNFATMFIAPSVSAVARGGLPLMFGMTVFAGFVQVCLSQIVRRLRPFLPPEVAGVVTFLLGVSAGLVGLRELLGQEISGPIPPAHWIVASSSLAAIVGLNIWTSGLLRISCVLVGFAIGYALALTTGLLPLSLIIHNSAPILALPRLGTWGLRFDPVLGASFGVAALISSIKAVAVVTACQRSNDAAYIRPDLRSMKRGVLADGIVTSLGGLLGTPAFNVAPSLTGQAAATGVTSRRVALAIAAMLSLLAFSPAVASLFAAVPDAVAGAMLVFSSCFVITSGVEIMASRLLDQRRMLVIACAILAAEGAPIAVERLATFPASMQFLAASPLLLGSAVALVLNLTFRTWSRRVRAVEFDRARTGSDAVEAFMTSAGAAWGARPDVIGRVTFALAELVDTLAGIGGPSAPIRIEARFDEFRIDLAVSYDGPPMPFPDTRPSADEIAYSAGGLLRLSGFLLRRHADGVRSRRRANASVVELHFDH